MTVLQVVQHTGEITGETPASGPSIPFFEGKPVSVSKLRITSTMGLEIEDHALRVDDIIHVLVEARVSQVHHNANEKTGDLERVHTAKSLSVEIVPWNTGDPADTGVFRG